MYLQKITASWGIFQDRQNLWIQTDAAMKKKHVQLPNYKTAFLNSNKPVTLCSKWPASNNFMAKLISILASRILQLGVAYN